MDDDRARVPFRTLSFPAHGRAMHIRGPRANSVECMRRGRRHLTAPGCVLACLPALARARIIELFSRRASTNAPTLMSNSRATRAAARSDGLSSGA